MTPTRTEPTTLELLRLILDMLASIAFSLVAIGCTVVWAKDGFGYTNALWLGLAATAISLLYDIRIAQRKAASS